MFKNSNMLKLHDIHNHESLKFIHNEIHNPIVFNFTFVGQIHNINTRRRHNLRPPRYSSTLSKNFVTYNGCLVWNEFPINIRIIVNKTTFKIKTKKLIINTY